MSQQIVLKNVSKIYGQGKISFKALCDINLDIKGGEFVAIVGPSGSGKSTLLNLIGLLDRPTEGEYTLEGKKIDRKTREKILAYLRNQKFGFVFQTFNLLPRMRALEQVILPTLYGKIKDRRQRALQVLKQVGLQDKIQNRPSELSGGEQQRVAIARALVCNPEIILADEPTGNLDSRSGQEIFQILQNLNKEGKTIILVTHAPDLAKGAHRIINLKDGRIE
jgi:putative ABC transport system ATP-binding protein